jgi:hypothetical protein
MVKKIYGSETVSSNVLEVQNRSGIFEKAVKACLLAIFASVCTGCFTAKELSPNDDEMQPPEEGASIPHIIPAPSPRY